MFRKSNIRKSLGMALAAIMFLGSTLPAFAVQEGACGVVGWEVRSTNTPGGGGELHTVGSSGVSSPWSIATPAPTVAGSAVINIVITYYHCKECRDAAKKKQDEDKKKADEAKKGGKKGGKKPADKKPPQGPDVPTFDPRTHELRDGKVVPKPPPKQDKPAEDPHRHCDKPERFECGQHWLWWLKNHDHRTEPKRAHGESDRKPVDSRYDGLDRKIKQVEPDDQKQGMLDPGSRIIMTGTVVAGEEARVAVVDSQGALLSGVVVALPDGQTAQTDSRGRARFEVPLGIETVMLSLVGTQVVQKAWAWNSGTENGGKLPAYDAPCVFPPTVYQLGRPMPVCATGLTSNQQVMIDGAPVEPLAWSPTGFVADVPADLPAGTHSVVIQDHKVPVAVATFDAIQLVPDPPKTLVVGKPAKYRVRIVGTQLKVDLGAQDLSAGVIRMMPLATESRPLSLTNAIDVRAERVYRSTGGKDNFVDIPVQPLKPGRIQISLYLVHSSANYYTQK